MQIFLTTKVWREGKHYIAYTPELDIASQGKTSEHAEKRLREAVAILIEETKRRGTLAEVMRTAGFSKSGRRWKMPVVSFSSLEVTM